MNRDQYSAQISALRFEARKMRTARPAGTSLWLVCNGVSYTAFKQWGLGAVSLRTSMLSERPRRALACGALYWAGEYRRMAKASSIGRARNLAAARACLAEASAYRSAFNYLP